MMFSSQKEAGYLWLVEQLLQGCSGLPKLDIPVNVLQPNQKVSVWFRNRFLAFLIARPLLYQKSD